MLQYQPKLDRVYHALSDPHRRAMVDRLARGGATVSELAEPLPMSMSAVVQHLRVLEASGLVRSSKSGRVRTCEIRDDVLQAAEGWIAQRRTALNKRLDRLERFLNETEPKTNPRRKP